MKNTQHTGLEMPVLRILHLAVILPVFLFPVPRVSAAESSAATERAYSVSRQSLQVPELELVDRDSNKVDLQTLLATGSGVLVNFIFTTCPSLCPVMSATFSQVQKQLGADRDSVLMISVSIDPEHDNPAQMADYARRFNAGPRWKFLTGSMDDIVHLQRAFDAFRGDKMSHQQLVFLRKAGESDWIRVQGFANASDLIAVLNGEAE